MAPYLRVVSIVLGFSFLAMVNSKGSMELKDICIGSSYKSIKEVGQGGVLEVGANTTPLWNPCVMRVETCAHCKVVVEPYGQDFSLLGCNSNYDTTGKSCPVGCQYFYIFDQFYKNQTMSFYKDSSATSWNLPFVSESSVVFIGFCHANVPLNRSIQLRFTIEAKEERYGGSSDISTSGEITSPFFPDLYSLNSEYYTYQIESTNKEDHVYIIFTDWDISSTSEVFVEWGSSEALYKYRDDRPVIMASSHKVKIVFNTGYEYQHGVLRSNMGFRVKYRYINANIEYVPVPSTNCGEYSFSSGGKLEFDTSIALNYKYYDCVWVVRTAPGYTQTLLNIIKFNIGTSGFDSDDYMEIYRGLSSKGTFLDRFPVSQTISKWQYKDTDGFYIHLSGKFGRLDKVQLSFVSLHMEELCSSLNNLWHCNNGYCISSTYKCDGIDHCGDNSDEQYGCSSPGSPWKKSSQQTLAFSVVIPVVISVFLIVILFVLFLLVRRYRRAQREVIRRASEGLPSISEDLAQPHGRRRRRRHRGVIGEDLPPAYEEAIRSPPMYPDISLDPPGPGHWMLPKPPPYSESVGTPIGPAMPPCFHGVEDVSTECALASNSSTDSSESEQWDGPRNHQLTDDSSDASPVPRVRTTHSYSTSYSSESSIENPHSPRHVRYAATETEATDQNPRDREGRPPPRQEGDGLTELPIRHLLINGPEGLSGEAKRNHQTERQANPHHQGQPLKRQTEQHGQDPSARRGRGRNETQPTERPTDRVHRNRHTDRHHHSLPTERGADRHFQDQPRERQIGRRDDVRRNLFKSSESSSPYKAQSKSQTKLAHDKHNKHRLSPAKVGTSPIENGHKAKLSDFRKETRTRREDGVNQTQALHNHPGSRPSQYHTSMPNIADQPALSRPGFQSLSNFSSAGAIQEATGMSGNIQPKHRQYAKSLENISKVAGSQALRPFHFDRDLDPVRSEKGDRASRNSWSPRETGQSRMCEENPGTSREALCGDSNTLFRSGEFNTSSGCVNAAFCESPTREIPPVLISGQGNASLPRSVTDMHVISDSSGSKSRVQQQPHISLQSDLIDNDDNECYA
ncbi:uncharacterized protein LOC110449918 [Mizuhopecten yessoensis]|uniref:Neuropilin and tolloid-like protein 2 n=1 Tax=Mizuhopecten yessoensis TaxID=6573 RepID=A0A210QQ63_MIZYE|nr:uncharacterized protein LOC110449918 [Mizuhopecten yessoensis]XP_021352761.1 uncharacterized protein LOC110449918 [Mizuhopecten yessoensis]XP_021352762.1 uncharacterized protein LOC110449918 [Mizuhopecten yessoensis]XP_021352763.1 uncharacterized protein LOC110449918 [Mizuhopecten yessoensis]XP_021352764.1 uncharacterized protein LOC110449918 [Mizuhopecten yessoensis]OWF50865.1 Neuropilin and tolloid-like protein 2 [Mizuhopecten yessoensis]